MSENEVSWGRSSTTALVIIYTYLGRAKCLEFVREMFEAGDAAFDEYKGDRQTKGKIRRGYYDWARKMRQAMRELGDRLPFDARDPNSADLKECPDAPLGDPALKEPEMVIEVDPITALLDEAIAGAAPAPAKPVELSQEEKDEMLAAVDQEQAEAVQRRRIDSFLEDQAQSNLKTLCQVSDARDFIRLCLPELVYYQGKHFLFLSSATFKYKDSLFVRNCVVDEESVKVGHDDVYRLNDNTRSHLIRSATVGESSAGTSPVAVTSNSKNRYVKVLRAREGMLIRYFTQVDGKNSDRLAWYGVHRKDSGFISAISYGEYKTLEAALKKNAA